MATVVLKSGVALAYGGASRANLAAQGEPANIVATVTPKVTLKPGVNTVAAEAMAILQKDVAFLGHVAKGFISIVEDDVVDPVAEELDPRAKLAGEKPKDYAARMAALDAAEATATNDAAFLAGWDAMSPEDKTAMEATLTDHEKELLAARPTS